MFWKCYGNFQMSVLMRSSPRLPIISGLRDYGVEGQLGLEPTLNEYLDRMLAVTAELKRVLKPTGTMWWNHGDSYGGLVHADWSSSNLEIAKKYQKNNRMSDFADLKIKKGYEKCLLLQAHRLAIRMVDDDGDDLYELSPNAPDWVLQELKKRGIM